MKTFEDKWKDCVSCARQAPTRAEKAPFGFAGRVLARVAARVPSEAISLELIWQRLALRSLSAIAVCLVACAAFEIPRWRVHRPLETGIENTVAQLIWRL